MSIEFSAQAITDVGRAQSIGLISPIVRSNASGSTAVKTKAADPAPQSELISSEQKVSDEDLNAINNELKAHEIALQFSRDKDTGTIVMKLVNNETGEALRQIPNEVTLKLAATLGKLQGGLFNRRA